MIGDTPFALILEFVVLLGVTRMNQSETVRVTLALNQYLARDKFS